MAYIGPPVQAVTQGAGEGAQALEAAGSIHLPIIGKVRARRPSEGAIGIAGVR
jgi:hypothetical protein